MNVLADSLPDSMSVLEWFPAICIEMDLVAICKLFKASETNPTEETGSPASLPSVGGVLALRLNKSDRTYLNTGLSSV